MATSELVETSTSRIARGIASQMLGQVLALVQSLVLVPLFLQAWGSVGYGRWLSVTAATVHLTLLDLGGQTFVGNALAHAFGRGDHEEFRRHLTNGLSLSAYVTGAGMLIVFTIAMVLPGLSSDIRAMSILLGASYLLAAPSGILTTVYRATGQLPRGIMIGNAARLLGTLVSIAALVIRVTPLTYSALFLAIAVGTTATVVIDLRRLPEVDELSLSWTSAKQSGPLIAGSLVSFVQTLSQTLCFHGVLIALSFGLGPQAVALYATHRTAAGFIAYANTIVQPAIWTELSFLVGREYQSRVESLTLSSIRATVLIAAMATFAIWAVVPQVFAQWTRHQFVFQPALLAIISAQGLLMAGWSTASWPIQAANRQMQLAPWYIANTVITLAGAVLAISLGWGTLGVAAATLGADVVCGLLVFPILSARFIGTSSSKIYTAIGRPVLAVLPLALVSTGTIYFVNNQFHRLIGSIVIVAALLLPTLWAGLGRHGLQSIYLGVRATRWGSPQ